MSDKRAFFGTIALGSVNVARLGLQLLILPILARILGPDAFGLLGLAMPFIFLAGIMSDAGMGNALVREPNPSLQLESTVFWLALGVGTSLAVVICLLAPILAAAFEQPKLAPVLMALSLVLVLAGSLAVSNARITRARNFVVFAIGEVISLVLSATMGIYAALHGFGLWSLVIQQLVLWITKTLWLFPVSKFRPALFCRPALARPYMHFSLNSVAASLADFAGKSMPSLVVGGALGVTLLGHYSMAYQLTRVPEMVISGPVYLSIFAAVARVEGKDAARPLVLSSLRMMLLALALLFCGLYFSADVVTQLLLGPKWAATGPIMAALAPAGFFLCLYSFMGAVLLGLGNSARQFMLTALCGIAMLLGALLGTRFDINGVAIGISAGAALLAPFYLNAIANEMRLSGAMLLSVLVPPLAATTIMTVVMLAIHGELTQLGDEAQLLAIIVVGTLSFAAAIALTGGRRFIEDLKYFRPWGSREIGVDSSTRV